MSADSGYSWIKVKKYKMDESLSWEERYKQLEAHHIEETTFLIEELRMNNIDIPREVTDQMEDGERLVGYFKNLFNEEMFFTKFGCHTTEGCRNYIYRSECDYVKEKVSDLDPDEIEKYEKRFISAFLWN